MANKKINQLVLKTTIQSTDLFPLGDATTGQLYKKTVAELQAAIGGAVISVNGLVGTVVLDTDDIQELASPTNKYFTDARARAAISLTTTGNSGASTYSSSTGVLNVPTYTLAGLGGITASFLSGGTGITYNSGTGVISYSGTVFTDASIRALISAGAGLSYNSSTGVFSYSGTVYTDASIRALISLTTTGSSGASTYNNTTGVLNVPTYTLAGLGGIGAGFLSGGTGITYNSSTGVIATTITQYTDALARAAISAGTGISYNSATGVITNTITQYTDALARASITGGTGISYNNTTGVITNTITQYTDALARASLSGGTGITYNSSTGAISYSGTVYTDSSVRGLLSGTAPITYNSSTGAIGITQASSSTNGFLSSTDWNTFNNKQGTITLTTSGTSGAATFNGSTLNIPQYTTDLSGYVTLTTAQTISGAKTFSSALNGTSATFSSSVSATSLLLNGSTSSSELLGIQSSQSKTYTTQLALSRWHTNESIGSQFKLNLFVIGNATGSSRVFKFQTSNEGVANDGIISLQSDGGNVGIGSTAPDSKLNITGGSTRGLRIDTDSGVQAISISPNGIFGIDEPGVGNGRFVINTNGNVGIGSTAPSYKLSVNGVGSFAGSGTVTGTVFIQAGHQWSLNADQSGGGSPAFVGSGFYIRDENTSTTAIGFTPGGNTLLGTTTDNGERLYVSGSIRATGSITANSDARLKKNIERIENALEKVGQISGYTYNTIYDEDRHAGVIAQEIDLVLPEIVNKGNDGLMGVEYGNISALLIEAIKEQKVLIESLQAKVEALSK